ncbi:unnamed protein product [Rotaria sp. Silwood1]|nr:unnamed protein product [Rotaria sp. Silwood1]CAF1664407.1 unnamed protein product [Rotaria sp. Silwood1]CAF3857414.1 unnamed protein product [Rotaria sp. Silwood1]
MSSDQTRRNLPEEPSESIVQRSDHTTNTNETMSFSMLLPISHGHIERNDWKSYIKSVRDNDINWVNQYIKRGGDLNNPIVPQGAIHCAVFYNFMEMLKLLLEAGINVNQQDEDGDTALHYAVGETKNIECINLLLSYGACPFIKNYSSNEETPIDLAIRQNHREIIELLTENIDLTKRLCKAAENGDVDLVYNLLTTTKVKINGISHEFVNPLHEASLAGHLSVVKLLSQFNANINAKTTSESTRYNTPLHCAATKGHLDIVKYLLEKGAEKEILNINKHTPLLCAIIMERTNVAEYLIRNGCDVMARDSVRKTPLHWASFFGLNDIILLLLEHGADINALADFGQPPLHCAVGYPFRTETIKLLIEKGAHVNLKNEMGLTILDYCHNNNPNDTELIQFIKQHVS